MLTIRKGTERGVTKFGGWLDSRHTFSFGDYDDPKHHQFRTLQVINDDRVAASSGFPTHPHRDMEILTCVLSGQLEHRDSMGNGEVIHENEWQAMTAGTGITHSEFNPSKTEPVHLLQIWLFPDKRGHTPGYQQKVFTDADKARQVGVGRLPRRRGWVAGDSPDRGCIKRSWRTVSRFGMNSHRAERRSCTWRPAPRRSTAKSSSPATPPHSKMKRKSS